MAGKIRVWGRLLLAVGCWLWCSQAAAQVACPVNIDFEQGLGNWTFYTGSCCPINTPNLTGPVNNRHTWTSGTTLDAYGNFPIVAPNGGLHSLKLGTAMSILRQKELPIP